MDVTDFIRCAQQVNLKASVLVDIEPDKNTLMVRWSWKDQSGSERVFKRAILLKELNYDEAISVFFSGCSAAIENQI
ncbi:hypothetical protein [Budvicia diplopodorum]|uniref:hypothetical protein n=1 Tax=Budvicia diplopodorum TaxID=1119056 RepID=UPI00135C7AD2|nr:hypothetical protein [Budvicia diplopodorum]